MNPKLAPFYRNLRYRLLLGKNLLTYSEEISGTTWSKNDVNTTGMGNVTTAPDGTTTADQLIENSNTSGHWVARSPSFVTGTPYTLSVYYKDKTSDRFPELIFPTAAFTTNVVGNFDLINGVCQTSGPGTSSMISVGDGWWRCSITATATTTASGSIQCRLSNNYSLFAPNYLGNNTSGVYIWGTQLEEGTNPSAYKKTIAEV